jgi:hypothetical protein
VGGERVTQCDLGSVYINPLQPYLIQWTKLNSLCILFRTARCENTDCIYLQSDHSIMTSETVLHPTIFSERLIEATNNLSGDNCSPERDINPRLLEYESDHNAFLLQFY